MQTASCFLSRLSILFLASASLFQARASTVIDFSFVATTTYSGSSIFNEPVAGTIVLPDIAQGGSGTDAASSITFTLLPPQWSPSLFSGNNPTNWAQQFENSFTVVNGVLTSAQFLASNFASWADAITANQTLDDFCINTTSSYTPGPMQCPAYMVSLGETPLTVGPVLNVTEQSSFDGINFPFVPPSTPEPATWLLVAPALLALAVLRHRRPMGLWLP